MKVCTKCKEEKQLIDFYWRKDQNKYKTNCKVCVAKENKEYRLKNIDNLKKKQIEYYEINKLKIAERNSLYWKKNIEKTRNYQKEYCLKNKQKIKEYYNTNKLKINARQREYIRDLKIKKPIFKLRHSIGNLIYSSIKRGGYTKKSKTFNILGCTFEEFKKHLESQFTKGMTWENQGEWHMDHIYPISLAKDEEELIKLNHYTNFQPLWASDNLTKGNKIIEKQLILI